MNSYLIIEVKGRNINRFLHKLKENNINVYQIKYISHKEILIKINEKDYSKLLKIKTIYKIEIINNQGFSKLKELINKNKILIIASFIGILFLILLTNIIFEVKIISNSNELNNVIKKQLEIYNIKKYNFKKSYDELAKIKEKILNKYKDNIEWIEITEIGTKYEVKIVERKKNDIKKNTEYTNIVAKKSGIIKEIYAEKGIKNIEPNTYVNKGDIIISGTILKGEDIMGYVHAKGKVYAQIWYNVNIEFPLNYTEKIYTNNKVKRFYLKLNNKYVTLNKYNEFERKTVKSLKSNIVPFEIGIEEEKEVKIINDTYTIEEAKTKAIEKAKEKVLQSLDKDEYIIEQKVLNFSQKNSKIILDIFFSCYEEIGKEEKIIINDVEE